jgi:spore germination protein GerM
MNCFLSFALLSLSLSACTQREFLSQNNGGSPPPKSNNINSQPKTSRQANLYEQNKITLKKNEFLIYFVLPQEQSLQLVPVKRRIISGSTTKEAIEQLLSGPNSEDIRQGLKSEIPLGTVLIDLKEEPTKIEINLSQRFFSGGGTDSISTRLDQLKNTVSPLAKNKDVFLLIEGKKLETAPGEGIEISQPFNK